MVAGNSVYEITSAKNPAYGDSLGADGIYGNVVYHSYVTGISIGGADSAHGGFQIQYHTWTPTEKSRTRRSST